MVIFQAVRRWIDANKKDKDKTTALILSAVRLALISYRDAKTIVLKTKLITAEVYQEAKHAGFKNHRYIRLPLEEPKYGLLCDPKSVCRFRGGDKPKKCKAELPCGQK